MEVIKLVLCRLCAQNRRPDEIVGQIKSIELDIESKLIVCCQWNKIEETECNEMPQNVCDSCFTNLNQSWNFAEHVKRAQIELYSKFVNGNIGLDAKPELKIEPKFDCDDDESIFPDALNYSNLIELKLETNTQSYSPLSIGEQAIDFDPMDQIDQMDDSDEFNGTTNDVEASICTNIIVSDKQKTATMKFNERNFLKSFEKNDRNTDGSVKLEAIQRLGLDNWSIIQYKCYLCKVQLNDHYDWRSHIKIEHPGEEFRHLCNICNVKHYQQRKPLLKHVISNHRRYFKYCCRKCSTYYWDLNRLRSHSKSCRRSQNEQTGQSLCDICGKEVKNSSILRVHRRIHFEETKRTFECYLCRKALLSRNNLKHHILIAHISSTPQHTCSFCGKGFSRKTKCNRHLKTHLDVFPFECTFANCNKKFRFKTKLNTHIRTHTGERKYACILCTYRCTDSGNLCKHMKQKHGMTKTEAIKRQMMGMDVGKSN